MEILFNIKDLLEKSNQVVLPGLGSFSVKRIEGFFDDEKNTFFPPKETVEFSRSEVTHHPEQKDVLIEFISSSKNISATSASYILSKHLENLKKNLQVNGEVYFQDIGKLKYQDSEITFEAENEEKLANSFFGLPSFKLPSENKEPIQIEKVEIPTNFSLAEQALNASITHEELLLENKPRSKKWVYFLLAVVIIALSVSALYLYKPDIYNSIGNLNFINTPAVITIDSIEKRESAIADSIYRNDVVKNLESEGFEVETVKDSADITVNQKVVPNKNNIRYEVIIAAWQTRTKAEDHLKKLRANGIDAHIVDDADGFMIKISAATLYNQKDAEKELSRIREELNPEAFIKPIRPLN